MLGQILYELRVAVEYDEEYIGDVLGLLPPLEQDIRNMFE